MAQPQSGMPPPAYLMEMFQKLDKDQSGSITANELQTALSNGTWTPFNPETVRLMLNMFDKSNKGTISFEDFGALWKYIVDWQNCFRSFDKDNSGNIDRNELRAALQTFGYNLNDATVTTMLQKFDRIGKGTVLFDDFIQCCIMLNNLTTAFRQFDTDQDGVVTLHYEQFVGLVFSIK
ncbi:programmed cell death protein 6-like [Metopolophium dirhodum]|uniref:programmed cell death protein 6-like n=1 Tax=Metopolophium dirhodum TaxID=44670 RepID=UPI0029902CCE|nr:programmed cell death protein 6-like [Metopolophium dirhodum]